MKTFSCLIFLYVQRLFSTKVELRNTSVEHTYNYLYDYFESKEGDLLKQTSWMSESSFMEQSKNKIMEQATLFVIFHPFNHFLHDFNSLKKWFSFDFEMKSLELTFNLYYDQSFSSNFILSFNKIEEKIIKLQINELVQKIKFIFHLLSPMTKEKASEIFFIVDNQGLNYYDFFEMTINYLQINSENNAQNSNKIIDTINPTSIKETLIKLYGSSPENILRGSIISNYIFKRFLNMNQSNIGRVKPDVYDSRALFNKNSLILSLSNGFPIDALKVRFHFNFGTFKVFNLQDFRTKFKTNKDNILIVNENEINFKALKIIEILDEGGTVYQIFELNFK